MWFPIVVLLMASATPGNQPRETTVGGPDYGYASLERCLVESGRMASLLLAKKIIEAPDDGWIAHSVGCAHNPTAES